MTTYQLVAFSPEWDREVVVNEFDSFTAALHHERTTNNYYLQCGYAKRVYVRSITSALHNDGLEEEK